MERTFGGRFWRTVSVAAIILLVAPLFAVPAEAQSATTVVVSATVAPVRYVLLDSSNRIIEIQSNSSSNVTPQVYKGSYSSAPVPLTPAVYRQYEKILAGVSTKKAGTIYTYSPHKTSKQRWLSWFRMSNDQSMIWFRKLHF